jgi:hypothetical protein
MRCDLHIAKAKLSPLNAVFIHSHLRRFNVECYQVSPRRHLSAIHRNARMKVVLAGAGAFGIKHLDAIRTIGAVEVMSLVGGQLEATGKWQRGMGLGTSRPTSPRR